MSQALDAAAEAQFIREHQEWEEKQEWWNEYYYCSFMEDGECWTSIEDVHQRPVYVGPQWSDRVLYRKTSVSAIVTDEKKFQKRKGIRF